jgi:predicted MFS family arabinose efflux permease
MERIGKALRAPARSHIVSVAVRTLGEGKGFGLDEALDQIGAITGPLLCAYVMSMSAGSLLGRYRAAFLTLALPGVGTFLLLLLAWRRARLQRLVEPSGSPPKKDAESQQKEGGPTSLGRPLRLYLLAIALLAAGFVDWALVGLHFSRSALIPPSYIPLLYAEAMAVDGIAALVLGVLFDRWKGRRGAWALVLGTVVSLAAPPLIFLPIAGTPRLGLFIVGLGVALWGVGMGAQESICKAAIARFVPAEQRARAYGTFYSLYGISWWAGSAILGLLYDRSRLLLVLFSVTAMLLSALLLFFMAMDRSEERG